MRTSQGLGVLAGSALILGGLARSTPSGIAIAAVGGGIAARALGWLPRLRKKRHDIHAVITIGCPRGEIYRFIRNLDQLEVVFGTSIEVTQLGRNRSHWTLTAPGDLTIEWDAELTADESGRRIAWRTLRPSDVMHEGEILLTDAPGDRGVEVHYEMTIATPGGNFARAVAALGGVDPEQLLRGGLYRLKQLLETGEIATTRGQPHGSAERRLEAGTLPKRIAEAFRAVTELKPTTESPLTEGGRP